MRSMENKHTIYFNMCNHYKKIYNAKAYVDTSTPKTFRRKISQPSKSFNNIHQINVARKDEHTECAKNNLWFINQKQTISSLPSQFSKASFFMRSKESISSSVQSNNKVTNDSNKSVNNKSVRKYAVSAHYHPSKRKPELINMSRFKNHTERHEYLTRHGNIGEHRLSSTDVRGYLDDSSSDSAYNEGSAGESRGSSPKQMKSLSAAINKRKPILKEERHFHEKTSKTRETKNCSDEILYIRFLKDITDDILRKNVFTNKAMKCIFQHHIQQNIWHLNKNRMLVEIEKLQEQLGIPKDDKFNDIGFGLGDILNSNSCDAGSDRSNFDKTANNNRPVTAPSFVTENRKKNGQYQTTDEASSSSSSKFRQSSVIEKPQREIEIIDARTARNNNNNSDNDKDVNNNSVNSKFTKKQPTDQPDQTSNELSYSENSNIKSDHHAAVSCEYYSDNFEDDSPPDVTSISSNLSENVAIDAAVAPRSAESSDCSNANDEIDEQFDDNEEDSTSENTVNERINSDSDDNSIDEENSSADEMTDIVDECEA